MKKYTASLTQGDNHLPYPSFSKGALKSPFNKGGFRGIWGGAATPADHSRANRPHRLAAGIFRVIAVLAVLAVPAWLQAAPQPTGSRQILNFDSLIQVHRDSSMTVTETIVYQTEVRRHGIVRNFPTTYHDAHGNTVRVGFKVLEVLRDGKPEPYHLKSATNGERVFIGKANQYLSPGVYTYTIKYRTDRQLGFFKDHDELYWNVTGNAWEFPIMAAQARVELPPGGQVLKYAAYTGRQGEKGQDFQAQAGVNDVSFQTTSPLYPGEGLTVVVAWPKGVVQAPAGLAKSGYWLRDHLSSAAGVLGLVLILGYYLVIWYRVGRDPAAGTIIPLFTPPQDFSPAAVRYLMQEGFDNKVMAASVVDMAVKGYLTIEEKESGVSFLKSTTYTLRKKRDSYDDLAAEEIRAAAQLFSTGDAIELKSENHSAIKAALDTVKETLRVKLEKHYFVTNLNYFIAGIVLTLAILAVIVLGSPREEALVSGIMLTFWTVGCSFLAVFVYHRWVAARGGGFVKILVAIVVTLFALPFAFGLTQIGLMFLAISPVAAVGFAGMVFANPLFYYLLKAPTLAGRGVMDQVEGFKLFLTVTEKERLNLLNPPEKTPELFEKYLPYALALDVEVQWTEQFAQVLAAAAAAGTAYSPVWYSGRSFSPGYAFTDFSSGLGSSFSGAIASSATAPGSSSGFGGGGGGGFSGGGGGGGGGGDW